MSDENVRASSNVPSPEGLLDRTSPIFVDRHSGVLYA